jgi:hypothetical protein
MLLQATYWLRATAFVCWPCHGVLEAAMILISSISITSSIECDMPSWVCARVNQRHLLTHMLLLLLLLLVPAG